jgi:hypothetical protein
MAMKMKMMKTAFKTNTRDLGLSVAILVMGKKGLLE